MSLKTLKENHNKNMQMILKRMLGTYGEKSGAYRVLKEKLEHVAWSLACEHEKNMPEFYELMNIVAEYKNTLPTNNNWVTDDLVALICPEVRQNTIFSKLSELIYMTTIQRVAGQGEILLAFLCGDSEKAKKHGDVRVGGKNVEVKADAASIHQEEDSRYNVYNDLLREKFGLTPDDIKNKYKGWYPLPTRLMSGKEAVDFYSKLYRKWGDDKLEQIKKAWDETNDPEIRSQELGYLVLCEYMQHKGYDGILFTSAKKQKDGKIKAVYLADISDKEFIRENLLMKPQKFRGKSNESRPDGQVGIEIRKNK